MAFREIVGHERALGFLRRSIASGRSGASLIFHGPEGVGRRLAAISLAQALNCVEEPGEGVPCARNSFSITSPEDWAGEGAAAARSSPRAASDLRNRFTGNLLQGRSAGSAEGEERGFSRNLIGRTAVSISEIAGDKGRTAAPDP